MQYPLRSAVFEWVKEKKSCTDDMLLEAMNRNGRFCSPDELNKILMQLEILGLVTVGWVSKGKRRIEAVTPSSTPVRSRLVEF